MACRAWDRDLSKREYRHWVEVGRGMLITKNGITELVQRKMEAWHQSLVTTHPLASCRPCTCGPGAIGSCQCKPCVCRAQGFNCMRCLCKPRRSGAARRTVCRSCVCDAAPAGSKCAYCVIWKGELHKLNPGGDNKKTWTNCIWKEWWRDPWEVAKYFMSPLGAHSAEVKDASTTDLGGLLNLLEFCPFITPSVNRITAANAREVRNLWAHAPNQELSNHVKTLAKDYLKNLLRDHVFMYNIHAQEAELQLDNLFTDGLTIIRESELNMLLVQLKNELSIDLEALIEAQNLNEKIVNVQEDVTGLARTQKEVDSKIYDIRKTLQCLNSFILNHVQEVEKKMEDRIGTVHSRMDLLEEQYKRDIASQKTFLHYVNCDPDIARVYSSKLRDEILHGNLEAVKKSIVAKEINILSVDDEGQTFLHWAARCGQFEMCRLLLNNDCPPDSKDMEGCSPLHEAAKHNHNRIVRLLVQEYRANVNVQDSEYKFSPLHWAVQEGHIDVVRELISLQCDLELQDVNECTPLHSAAANGQKEIVDAIILFGAKTTAVEKNKFTPLHWAAYNGHTETVKVLLENGCNTESQDMWEYTPLIWAAKRGYSEVLNLLIEKGKANVAATEFEGNTALHWAAEEGFFEASVELIANGNNVDSRDTKGNSPLHKAVLNGKIEIVSLLLDSAADKDACGENNFTPLHLAVNEDKIDVIQQLLDEGANVEARNIWGDTPLHTAASKGHSEIVNLLLTSCNKADVNAITDEGNTALHLTAMHGGENHVIAAVELLQHEPDKEGRNKLGDTPLVTAARHGKFEMIELLINAGADVNSAGEDNYTALHWSSVLGYKEITQLLLDYVADIDCRDKSKYTPLLNAARFGHKEVAKLLLARGADVNAVTASNDTSLTLAENFGHREIKNLIKEKGGKSSKQMVLRNAVEGVTQVYTEFLKDIFKDK